MGDGRWQFWIDRGGTFTDVVAVDPDGARHTHKLLSENPEHYPDAALEGIRRLLGIADGGPIDPDVIDSVKMGTTVATNALLERTGDRTLLLVSPGMSDLLRIGNQTRPRLFDLDIVLPDLLHERVAEIGGRLGPDGAELEPLDVDAARRALDAARRDGIDSVAIVLMHGWRHDGHERALAELARAASFGQVSVSHEVSPLMGIVARGDTTVVDAYLSPILRRYVDRVAAELGETRLMFMQSNGGLVDARRFQGKDAIVSGPAGGVIGAVRTAAAEGFDHIVGFDMGGTSTDVCHYAGELERAFETEVAGVRMRTPMMHIHTVAAGGGSILDFDGARYRVGPESAGANPGPVAYRRGGPLTVTDCNVMVGKIQPDLFPSVFGPGADEPLDADAVRTAFGELADRITAQTGDRRTPVEVALGFLQVAVENMARAIKRISIERGYDVSAYALVCFGAAAGQHACQVADRLGIETVLVHPYAGVLSAFGMGLADLRALRESAVELPLADARSALDAATDELTAAAVGDLVAQGVDADSVVAQERVHLRYEGTDTALAVDAAPDAEMAAAFETLHRSRFGFASPGRTIIVESVVVEAVHPSGADPDIGTTASSPTAGGAAAGPLWRPVSFERGTVDTAFRRRSDLVAGARLDGPAVIVETTGTTVVEPGWAAEVTDTGQLRLERVAARDDTPPIGTDVDPVMLEIFNSLFMSVAEQMGAALQNTASSVNIKERLDYSCAVFDTDGNLVANAPHVPVHLGSMSESIKRVIANRAGAMERGDSYVLNDPYNGGTHLPDITVISPAFDAAGELRFFVASRGHHADVGGITPGSVPPFSTRIDEEGVLLDDELLVRDGTFRDDEILARLTAGPHPARRPQVNIADLKAQVAANQMGLDGIDAMVATFGLDVVLAYMDHVRANAAASVRRLLGALRPGTFTTDSDDGARVAVTVSIDADVAEAERRAHIDFTGTSPVQATNANAPTAVGIAAVLYVFRCLVGTDIPLNSGCLDPLDITFPDPSMLRPRPPAAVVAGNVETSQQIVDTLFGALGVMGASQGTMNNLTFGTASFQHYETIAGGSGAGPTWDGASATQVHMTNTRITDPEVLEWRFPVILEEFSIRRGSGGAGRHRGGDGVVRRIRFTEDMTASILAGHRVVPPYGMAGAEPGACGVNRLIRRDGTVEELPGRAEIGVAAGDVLQIETPGGGGYGDPSDGAAAAEPDSGPAQRAPSPSR